jgi:prepilin-type N-terminal cleavage/methylation domain-containing protein
MMRARFDRHRDDDGMTMVELMITSSVLVILLGMVFVSMSLIDDVSTNVSSQYQEFDQALPALAPFHSLLAAQIEPGPPTLSTTGAADPLMQQPTLDVPNPPFESIGNFAVTFYANIGTAYGNTVSCPAGQPSCTGSTAGPARIVAAELNQAGQTVSSSSTCSAKTPCSLQVRMYLPQTGLTLGAGAPSCPILWGSSLQTTPCNYTSDYRLLANVQDVVNNPNPSVGAIQPVFSYTFFDPGGTYDAITYPQHAIALTATEVDSQLLTGLAALGYPADTQSLGACNNPWSNYPPPAIACPADAIQSVGLDLMVAKPGATAQGTVENSLVVYRYAQSPGSSTIPFQYSETQG